VYSTCDGVSQKRANFGSVCVHLRLLYAINALLQCQYFLRWDKADTNSYYCYTGHIQPILQTLDNSIKNCETIYNYIISVLTTGANRPCSSKKTFTNSGGMRSLALSKKRPLSQTWKASGKPRQGFIFNKRQRCRQSHTRG